jgi:hypothetical protein
LERLKIIKLASSLFGVPEKAAPSKPRITRRVITGQRIIEQVRVFIMMAKSVRKGEVGWGSLLYRSNSGKCVADR